MIHGVWAALLSGDGDVLVLMFFVLVFVISEVVKFGQGGLVGLGANFFRGVTKPVHYLRIPSLVFITLRP